MATIGLRDIHYSKITESATGEETYAAPTRLAKGIEVDLTVELAEAVLYADDAASEIVVEFQSGTLSLGVDNIGSAVAADLTGATVDKNGVLVSSSDDIAPYVAIGFKAKKSNGKYRFYWLYRVKFGVPATNLQTIGENITFSTPTIEGTIMRRNKPDTLGKNPWKVEVNEDDTAVPATVISTWFSEVYEPEYVTP